MFSHCTWNMYLKLMMYVNSRIEVTCYLLDLRKAMIAKPSMKHLYEELKEHRKVGQPKKNVSPPKLTVQILGREQKGANEIASLAG